MKFLRKKNRVIIGLIVCTSLISVSTRGQKSNPIDVNVVKNDMMIFADDLVPKKFISKTNNDMFGVFYLDDFCLVHLPYKDVASDAVVKASIVAMYRFQLNKWKYIKIFPYNYNMSLLDEKRGIFLSDNLFCSSDGNCSTYIELAVLEEMEMKVISAYKGFDRSRYYDGLLSTGRDIEVRQVVGDTIVNVAKVRNFIMDNTARSYDLDRRIEVLLGVSDSLVLKKTHNSSKVYYK